MTVHSKKAVKKWEIPFPYCLFLMSQKLYVLFHEINEKVCPSYLFYQTKTAAEAAVFVKL
jgi:hypothetical protein